MIYIYIYIHDVCTRWTTINPLWNPNWGWGGNSRVDHPPEEIQTSSSCQIMSTSRRDPIYWCYVLPMNLGTNMNLGKTKNKNIQINGIHSVWWYISMMFGILIFLDPTTKPRQEWDSPEALEQHVRSGPKKWSDWIMFRSA